MWNAREATKQKHATKRSTEVVNHFQRGKHKKGKQERDKKSVIQLSTTSSKKKRLLMFVPRISIKKNSINFVHQSNSFSQFFQILISHKYDELSEHLYFFENIEPEQSTLCKITFYNSLLHMKIRAAFICCDGVIFAFYTVDN